jgi:hypothetical protein
MCFTKVGREDSQVHTSLFDEHAPQRYEVQVEAPSDMAVRFAADGRQLLSLARLQQLDVRQAGRKDA